MIKRLLVVQGDKKTNKIELGGKKKRRPKENTKDN